MNKFLYLTSQSGKLIRFEISTQSCQVLYQDPKFRYLFGVGFLGNKLYFSGQMMLGMGEISTNGFQLEKLLEFYDLRWDRIKRLLKKFWSRIGASPRVIKYSIPNFHKLNIHNSTIYVSVTDFDEVWEMDQELNLERRIVIQSPAPSFHHINNVFCDGNAFYVCLNCYHKSYGYAGYAKFDRDWNELERRRVGWESHALSVIDGKIVNLCSSSGAIKNIGHPHRAGLMVNGELVFEHDPDKYFCKDFSMDDEHIYIVGGESKKREERGIAAGVVFVLNRKYELLKECVLPGTGGLCGCRLPDVDYSNG